MAEPVREHGGVVQDFTGDGIMAVFGVPLAFEDGPLRACRSALNILQRLKAAGPDLEANHGVLNTGPAVVGKVVVSQRQRRRRQGRRVLHTILSSSLFR